MVELKKEVTYTKEELQKLGLKYSHELVKGLPRPIHVYVDPKRNGYFFTRCDGGEELKFFMFVQGVLVV